MNRKNGQAFLALVFLIGGIVLAIGITLTLLANSFVDTAYGYRALVTAEAAAASGAQDALLRLDRNIAFATSSYSFAVASNTATISVTQASPTTGFATILSVATVANRTRKISVVTVVNATTSQVGIVSWQVIQ